MNKEQCINDLKSENPSEEAILKAIELIEEDSSYRKGYRRFKKKYIEVKRQVYNMGVELEDCNEEAFAIFNRYFGDVEDEEDD